jgi:predicted Zn finger-like uncharacterized protein
MTETTERIPLSCPACSPDIETVHEVLSPGGQATVRCTACGHVHKEELPEERTREIDVVVSQEGDSFSAREDVPAEESLAVGEEFLLETPEAIMTVRITSLEVGDGRQEEAVASEVDTIWTRAVGNVSVSVTAHPKSGEHDETRSFDLQVPGDYAFVVGETEELGDEEFTVEGILVRDDAVGYDHEKLDFEGDSVDAKDVKRLYARDESTSAWSAW